ncbi:MAG: ABC transporter ATP-binding protein [Brumimicrobium sp.]
MTVLKVENVSKLYRLGELGTGTVSHDLNRWWSKVRGKEDPYAIVGQVNDRSQKAESDYVWALKDINFEVEQGEVLGIIGRNGAGKSTLLKILSQITSPTTGTIKTKGRIASLLEVGTGMHPEMTARENIYLNGAILGMTKKEIASKFDEIVDFSGCTMFVDTPLKRFSSGMRVRLGFAVAAFLEPEILIVDEVLAVGDAEFQKKAIGKMKDISAGGGRTVLFVSHNMASVKSLCTKGLVLENGASVFEGTAEKSVEHYLSLGKKHSSKSLLKRKDRFGDGRIKLVNVSFYNGNNIQVNEIISGEYLKIKFEFEKYDQNIDYNKFFIGINFRDEQEQNVLSFLSDEMGSDFMGFESNTEIILEIPNVYLRSGVYDIRVQTGEGPQRENHFDTIENVASIQVLQGSIWENGKLNRPGNYAVIPGQYKV